MCGITGFLTNSAHRYFDNDIRAMTQAIQHRGPDSDGHYVDQNNGIALGHRRLAIIDLSPLGAQPMHSNSGRFTIVFNGEIYNYKGLQNKLQNEGIRLRSKSDTEVILEAWEKWGAERCLQSLSGMFAFALWDHTEKCLYLARDRMGEKPLYYGKQGNFFYFGSELKSITAHSNFKCSIDLAALEQYFRFSCIPAPKSIYQNISKLPPATYIKIQSSSLQQTAPTTYWSLEETIRTGESFHAENRLRPISAIVEEIEQQLIHVVQEQMISDVPLGAFLSGGIDSSLILSIMQQQSSQKIRSFSIGFDDPQYDESNDAAFVAKVLNTDHNALTVSSKDALDLIPHLPSIYDEPFADSSQIPTILLAKLTKQYVSVSLSGDAGDEVFAGYNRYAIAPKLWSRMRYLPLPLRTLLAECLECIPANLFHKIIPALTSQPQAVDKFYKVLSILRAKNFQDVYTRMLNANIAPAVFFHPKFNEQSIVDNPENWKITSNKTSQQQYFDMKLYLPDDILVKVDRAAMYSSLETRIPLLDHRIVEAAWKIPPELHLCGGEKKFILKEILRKRIPNYPFLKPKTGFAIPLASWLRNELRPWAEELLENKNLDAAYFDPAAIKKIWQEHLSGTRDHQVTLWQILMFQAWRKKNKL